MSNSLRLILSVLFICFFNTSYGNNTAPISGFAQSFLMNTPITSATVTILETGQQLKTDAKGHFGPFQYPIGKPITLELRKWGYKTTQSGTFIVPAEGLTGPYHNITFQVPSIESFYLLQGMIGANLDKHYCHVVTTVTAYHKLLSDCPQGLDGAKLTLQPKINEPVFYFGMFESGALACKTNPYSRHLTATSADGGAGYFNLPPSDKPYILSAEKAGMKFSEVKFMCRKGAFINISPPLGPSEIKKD